MKKLLLVLCLLSTMAIGVTANKVWRVPTSGSTLGAWGPVNLSDNTNAVTGKLPSSNLGAVNSQVSSSCGAFSTSSGTPTQITNLSVTITTSGRPVMLSLQSDGTSTQSDVAAVDNTSAGSQGGVNIYFMRASTTLTVENATSGVAPTGQSGEVQIPTSSFHYLDFVAAGTYTYHVFIQNACNNAGTVYVRYAVLVANEL